LKLNMIDCFHICLQFQLASLYLGSLRPHRAGPQPVHIRVFQNEVTGL
jgi:hypothetical protein